MTAHIDRWQARIQLIKQQLLDLGPMRPGALSEQYNVCGKPNCKCKDPRRPQKHGPYYQLSYTHQGKSTSEFVKRDNLDEVRQQIANYAGLQEAHRRVGGPIGSNRQAAQVAIASVTLAQLGLLGHDASGQQLSSSPRRRPLRSHVFTMWWHAPRSPPTRTRRRRR
jgi:hypothetical protein